MRAVVQRVLSASVTGTNFFVEVMNRVSPEDPQLVMKRFPKSLED